MFGKQTKYMLIIKNIKGSFINREKSKDGNIVLDISATIPYHLDIKLLLKERNIENLLLIKIQSYILIVLIITKDFIHRVTI